MFRRDQENDVMHANIFSWHILNHSEKNQPDFSPSSSSSSANGINPSLISSLPRPIISEKELAVNPLTVPIHCSQSYYSKKEGKGITKHPAFKERGGIQRAPIVYEAIQGIPSTRYTLDDILSSLVIMVDPERRNSISLSEQCEIVHVLEDLALSLDFHQEFKRINQQIITICDAMNDNMDKDGEICKLYDPNEIFYTLLGDALASK